MPFRTTPLQTRLIIIFLSVLILPTSILTLVTYTEISTILTDKTEQNSYQVTRSRSRSIENQIVSLQSNIFYLTSSAAVNDLVSGNTDPAINSQVSQLLQSFFIRQHTLYQGACLLNNLGDELLCIENQASGLSFTPTSLLKNRKQEHYFNAPINDAKTPGSAIPVYISDISLNNTIDGQLQQPVVPILYYSAALTNSQGKTIGLVALKARLQPIFDSLIKDDPAQSIYLIDTDGNYLLHPDSHFQFGGLLKTAKASLYVQQPLDSRILVNKVSGFLNSSDLSNTLISYDHISPAGADYIKWILIYATPLSTVSSTILAVQRTPLLIALTMVLVISLLALLIARSITKPLNRLTSSAQAISQGQLDTPIPLSKGHDEIATLSNTFASMVNTLKNLLNQAAQTTRLNIAISQSTNYEDILKALHQALDQPDQISLYHIDPYPGLTPSLAYLALQLGQNGDSAPLTANRLPIDQSLLDNPQNGLFTEEAENSRILLPLVNAGRWQGLIQITWQKAHPFSADQQTTLNAVLPTLAATVAETRSVLIATQSEKASSTRAADLERVLALTSQIDSTLNPDQLTSWFSEKVASAFPLTLAVHTDQAVVSTQIFSYNGNDSLQIPIDLTNEQHGTIEFKAAPSYFSDDKILVLRLLVQQMASALQTSTLYSQQVNDANKMRALDKTKTVFLSNMSHELRTPLNIIIGYTSLLLQQLRTFDTENNPYADFTDLFDDSPELEVEVDPYQNLRELIQTAQKIIAANLPFNEDDLNELVSKLEIDRPDLLEKLQNIRNSGTSLLALVNDLLDLSKIESGRLDLVFSPLATSDLLQHIHETARGLAERMDKTHIDFQTTLAPDMPVSITTDRLRLEQIIRNLVSNAYKFTEHGSINVKLQTTDTNNFTLTVNDTGIGIAPENCEVVFDEFKQLHEGYNRTYGGTGLGLSITRSLIRMMDGSIQVASQIGHGSSFLVKMPLKPQD